MIVAAVGYGRLAGRPWGTPGGRIDFQQQASGGSARIVLNAGSGGIGAGGVLDISGIDGPGR